MKTIKFIWKMKNVRLIKRITFFWITFLAFPSFAQNSQVNWLALSSFGISGSTNSITITSAGQSFAGTSSNGGSKVISGFLAYTSSNVTGVSDEKEIIPTVYKLNQNYPNPFNPSTIINYQIPEEGFVKLKVYDILGREVRTLVNESKPAGSYNIPFDASDLASGMYIYRLIASNYISTKKMLLIK
jgi:Secretion system C-terminal sorting domain